MAVRVGRWDCAQCGHKGNLGPSKSCETCGHPRPPNVRFYLTDDAEVVTDSARLAAARAGADWVCSHCQAHNPAGAPTCSGCGSPAGDADDRKLSRRVYAPGRAPTSASDPGVLAQEPPAFASAPGPDRPRQILLAAGYMAEILLLILLVVRGVDALTRFGEGADFSPIWGPVSEADAPGRALTARLQDLQIEVPLTLVGVTWERTISTEERKAVEEVEKVAPPGARVMGSEEVQVGTRKVLVRTDKKTRTEQVQVGTKPVTKTVSREVPDGTESYVCGQVDMGNGYFEDRYCERPKTRTEQVPETTYEPAYEDRTVVEDVPVYADEPVYETHIRYQIDRWFPGETLRAAGSDRAPRWPELPRRPDLRESARAELYFAHVRTFDGQKERQSLSAAQWAALPPDGTTRTVQAAALSPAPPPPELWLGDTP